MENMAVTAPRLLRIYRDVLMLQLLHDDPGCTVADLPAGHVPVFDVYDGVLRVAAGHIVDDHLALVAELRRDARGDLLQRF